MNRKSGKTSEILLKKGLFELFRHRPDKAVETFRRAVEILPPTKPRDLSKALYWLSVALFRLGKRDLAVKSLSSSQKLRRRGFARKTYLRNINSYGMPRRATPELDDFFAFSSIQMAGYLAKRPNRRFESFEEQEIVSTTIAQSWKVLASTAGFAEMTCQQKLTTFKRSIISYPRMSLFSGSAAPRTLELRRSNEPARNPEDRCRCGSGLPYAICCGRTKGLGEI